MPRSIRLEAHFSTEELESAYLQAKDPIESRRWQLLWLVSRGYSLKETAQILDLNYDYARDIVQRYNAEGAEGVVNRIKTLTDRGKKPLLSAIQLQDLKKCLELPAEEGGVWTEPKVARWIAQLTGRKVTDSQGWRYLKRCRHSWQRPRPHHAKADDQAQAEFKKKLPSEVEALQQE